MNSTPLEMLTLSRFSELLRTRFSIETGPAQKVDLELVEAAAGRAMETQGQGAARFESFSLIFHGPGDQLLTQKIHTFEHATLGRFELFIVPVGQKPGIFIYQAVFNRLISPG